MTRRRILATVLAAAIVGTAQSIFARPVVADVQVIDAGQGSWIVRVRSSEAQAFDVVDGTGSYTVRLHGARLGESTGALGPTAFGAVALAGGDGYVDLRITLTAGLRAAATQGGSADVVDVRISSDTGA